ncbi:tetratricopeptide repeat protein [Actinacidiphila oryziradicis]|uniref:Tetratricopeptide repeat protein n=1 Tax=Actinacidiphila oryziradicis TaxID=2571141 RepID=A0A4U0SMD7_9ACTN|nr:tetratricopeptide repeat protein [Actinacidiphila oryziradicis]TKA11090.1 tetratricopeptide repeat protein [Actinacidiphila oryziradicis]
MTISSPDAGEPPYDIFICYAWDDSKQLADELHQALTEVGLNVFQDEPSMDDWDEMAPEIRAALLSSRTLLPLVSPGFPRSPHCRQEVHLALDCAFRLGRTDRVMAVTSGVRPDDIRPSELSRYRTPRQGRSARELAVGIAERVRALAAEDDRTFGDAPLPSSPDWFPEHLPGGRHFHGRHAELWEIHEGLRAMDKARNMGHPVVSVSGVGGQGKTALCAQYARLFALDHSGGVFLVRLSGSDRRVRASPDAVRAQFTEGLRAIGLKLELTADELGSDRLPGALRTRLKNLAQPYLWIVDDIPSGFDAELLPELCAPTGNGRTLLTTRGRFTKGVSAEIVLGGLDPHDGLSLLTGHRPPAARAETRAARLLTELLHGHPLGLTLAAGLTTQDDFEGYAELYRQLATPDPEDDLLELVQYLRAELPAGYARPFAATMLRSFRGLTDAGRDVLSAVGVLAAEPVPLTLLDEIIAGSGAPGGPARVADGLAHAVRHGLAELTESTDLTELTDGPDDTPDSRACAVHPLVARATRVLNPPPTRRKLRDAAVVALTQALSATRHSFTHRAVARSLPHVRAVTGLLAGTDQWSIGADERYLLDEAGRAYEQLGDGEASLRLYAPLAEACEEAPECDEYTRLVVRLHLASAHFRYGQFSAARSLQEDVVPRMRALLGPAARETLTAQDNLANTLGALGQHEASRLLHTEVYRALRDGTGPTDADTLRVLGNLVIAVGRCGDTDATRRRMRLTAVRYARGAHVLWRRAAKAKGPKSWEALGALDIMNTLGKNLLALGKKDEARDAFRTVWEGRRAVLGEHHPDTLDAWENTIIAEEGLS